MIDTQYRHYLNHMINVVWKSNLWFLGKVYIENSR